jgi:asparagine synthase (glutamine-hydrolysing)
VQRFWSIPEPGELATDRAAATDELLDLTRRATERQLVADVPLGMLLSGGLDSSLLTALARRAAGPELQCFTATYPRSDNNLDRYNEDAPHARDVARRLGVRLTEIVLRPSVADLWPRLIWFLDEPIADPAAIACYLICSSARQVGVPVLLSGQGADELFLGYPRYTAMHSMGWSEHLPPSLRKVIVAAGRTLPGSWEGRVGAAMRRGRRLLLGIDSPPERRFLSYCATSPAEEVASTFTPALKRQLGVPASFMQDCLGHMSLSGLSSLRRMQKRDVSIYLPNHNLLYTDKMGMAVGLEARVPFLDIKLVEQSFRYPVEWLIQGLRNKILLREASTGLVPQSVITRPKAGFGAPYRKWLRYDLSALWNDLVGESSLRNRGWFDPTGIRRIRAVSQNGSLDLYMLQWAVLTTEIWARQYIDRNPAEDAIRLSALEIESAKWNAR